MKFTSSSTELQKALGTVGGVIPSKSTLPILENFLFHITGDQLKITATDLDISMSITLKVKGTEDGTIAIPAKRLFETIRSLPAVDIEVDVNLSNNKITMLTDGGEYKLTGESSENYPTIPSFKGSEELEINTDLLRRLISKTVFAVSTDELRPSMMGILLQIKKKETRTVATDGHRLVRLMTTKITAEKIERDIVIPSKAVSLILKTADESSGIISFSENHVMFSSGNSVLISRLIEEKYPNYESVIPLENEKTLIVDKNQLLASVRRTSLYASSTTHQVRFSLKKGSLTISAEDIDFGSEARETMTCDYSSEQMEIGFNSAYIVDILSHIDTDEVIFKLSSPTRASIIHPSIQREGENLLMLVMPVRLNVNA